MFNIYFSKDVFFRSGVTRNCLKCMTKVPADVERFIMVVMMGTIVAETFFRRKVGIGSKSHCLFERHAKL